MTYRVFLLAQATAGLAPALVTLVFYLTVDRRRRWDRYARFVAALLATITLNYSALLLLTLAAATSPRWPASGLGWFAVALRLTGVGVSCWLAALYFRRGDRTPPPGSIPRIGGP